MSSEATLSIVFLENFQSLEDPRQLIKVLYPLQEILLLSLCAVISGAETFVDIVDYGHNKLEFLRQLRPFEKGIPSPDTLGAVFSSLNPKAFQECFVQWVSSLQQTLPDIVAIDGKTLCGSGDISHSPIHMVSAWACNQRLVLGQEKVDAKSNEITAIPKLLELLILKGAIVTLDALGCQRSIAEKILEKEADYVLALKGNQGSLAQDVREFFAHQKTQQFRHSQVDIYENREESHGRIEIRRCYSTDDVEWLNQRHAWPGLCSIVMIEAERTSRGKTQIETRFYLTSLAMDAEKAANAIRSHWQVENSLHWVLDVVFLDDQCRIRKDHAPQNFHIVKQMALNLIRQAPGKKSVRLKRKSAGWNDRFLLEILQTA